ncbi:hypothetical protein F4861DRAFT_409716 [Xylaria intraflava]|nr:hypothetical protein F4861DRAFT_409716 [Xylaria intraflava]
MILNMARLLVLMLRSAYGGYSRGFPFSSLEGGGEGVRPFDSEQREFQWWDQLPPAPAIISLNSPVVEPPEMKARLTCTYVFPFP